MNILLKKLLYIIFAVFHLSSTIEAGNITENIEKNKANTPSLFYNIHSPWVDSVFNSLTQDQRISQLFMVAAYSNRDQQYDDKLTATIRNHQVGGLIFFQGGPIRQATLTNNLQAITKTPLLIGMDCEWGLGMRLDSTISYPRQMMLGAVSDNRLIYDMGYEIAGQLKELGVYLNFAPVIDVNNNPDNPVINNRSFGEDKYLVASKGIAYMQGMQANGVIATAKHFPGHGDTNADSHFTFPIIKFDTTRLDTLELFPFKQLINNKLGGLMIAHLFVPMLDSTVNTASTLSYKIVTGLLKKKLGYNGLIFTDALNMKGVSNFFKPGELEVKAIQAGNDVLVMPSDIPKALSAIKAAIIRRTIRQSQIDSSCRKILAAKEWVGLQKVKLVDISSLNKKLNSPAADLIQRRLVESAITIVKNQDNLIPLKSLDTLRMAVLMVGTDKPNKFSETLSLYAGFDTYYLPKQAYSTYIDSLFYNLRHYNIVIAGILNTDYRPTRNFGITHESVAFLDSLSQKTAVILDLFATPYSLAYFKHLNNFKSIIISFEDQPIILDYSAQMIFGAIGAKGKLSVTATPSILFGKGINTSGNLRLKYTIPEDLNIDSNQLTSIDSIVNDAIHKGATPGCQILAAKNGVVFYHKSFGYQTYDTIRRVKNTDIYDLASITKISATLPSVMKLYEENKINLKNKLSVYLPEMKKSNKKDIILLDMLTHQARLKPFIPFYERTIEPSNAKESILSTTYSFENPIKLGPKLYANKNIRYRNGYYTSKPDILHGLQVADNLFILNSYADSIFLISKESKLLSAKEYKYSDMDFYYLFWIVERITHKPMSEYVETNFYNKLGAYTMGYLPLNRFEPDRIPPTENDVLFRKQVVQGYVHDPGAAMMGGVCGHAGLFSNANDLAKLMQMYLNKGTYGGEQYFKPETIDYFTSCPFCENHNRRGIGFDKPDMNSVAGPTCQCVSAGSFGHTGFTGTFTWADPETGLLYVFLSNRVYPDAGNSKITEMDVRTKIQEVLAKSIR